MSLLDAVRQQLGPNEIQQISQKLGVDPATAEQAVQSALPSMMAGMAGHSQESGGASSIESALGGLSGALGGGSGLGAILGSILGRHEDTVHQDVQQTSGLDSAQTRQLLMLLAPIVLAALARHRSQTQAGPANAQPDLGDVLKHEAQQAEPKRSGPGGLLGKILSYVETPRA